MTNDLSATERAQETASSVSSEGQHVAGVATDEVKNVAAQTKDQVRGLADQARTEVGTHVDEQTRQGKDRLASTLGGFGDDLGQMAENGSGLAAQVAHEVAERAQSLGRHLDGREPSELLDDVRRFARERPGTFLLGSLAAGVIAGRLLRGTKDSIDAAEAQGPTSAPDVLTDEPYVTPGAPNTTSVTSSHGQVTETPAQSPAQSPVPSPAPAFGEGVPADTTGYSSPPPGTGLPDTDPLS